MQYAEQQQQQQRMQRSDERNKRKATPRKHKNRNRNLQNKQKQKTKNHQPVPLVSHTRQLPSLEATTARQPFLQKDTPHTDFCTGWVGATEQTTEPMHHRRVITHQSHRGSPRTQFRTQGDTQTTVATHRRACEREGLLHLREFASVCTQDTPGLSKRCR